MTPEELVHARTGDTSVDGMLARLLAALRAGKAQITAWQSGGTVRTLNAAAAEVFSDLYDAVAIIANGTTLDASGDWLTLHAASRFQVERIAATFAEHTISVACESGAGPVNLSPAELVVRAGSRVFHAINTSNVTVPDGGAVSVTVRAEFAGARGNVGAGAINTLVAPTTAGLSITHTAQSFVARDTETDEELRERCRERWNVPELQACGTRGAYSFHVTSALMPDGITSCGATRVGFLSPDGTGAVPIRIAGASGLLSDEQRDGIRAWIAARAPLNDTPQIEHAATVAVDLTGTTVRFKPGFNVGTNREAVQAAVRDLVNRLPMGDDIEPAFLDEGAVAAAIYDAVPGVVADVDLTCGDVTIREGRIAVVDETVIAFS